ncbi:MAG: carboxypeptidase-like regulatory domain-containing protein [Flavobacteriales bacterium]
MRNVLIPLGCLLAGTLAAQAPLTCRVVDAEERSALPYATVQVQGTTRGTISNAEGRFQLPVLAPQDSIRITYVGYRTVVLPFSALRNGGDVPLHRATVQLATAEVRPGEDLYDRVLAASAWLWNAPAVKSKLFFGMETHSEDQPVEVLQAYYSANFRAAMLTGLDFQQGRVGITPKNDRHFINFNTARAFALLDIHAKVGAFPSSPFAHRNARSLKKDHQAEWVSVGSGPDGVDHVRVVPRGDPRMGFTLDLWLKAGTAQVRSLELSCTDCVQHPFVPLLPGGRIDAVDMRYEQTWSTSAPYLPEVMELEYHTTYSGNGFQESFHTQAVMHAFDLGSPFIPTLFPWTAGLEEYRMIAWMPENPAFWQRMSPPLPTERQLRDQAFIAENDVRASAWYNEQEREYDLLRPIHTAWSPDARLDLGHVQRTWAPRANGLPDPNKVELKAYLYLALDTTGRELQHYSMAVFDEMRSIHAAPAKPWTRAFLNIYFDLCELERRRMEQALNEPGVDVERARMIHTVHSKRLSDNLDDLMAQTRKGQARTALTSWNEKVEEALGINNFVLLEALPTDFDLPVDPNCFPHPQVGVCVIGEPH